MRQSSPISSTRGRVCASVRKTNEDAEATISPRSVPANDSTNVSVSSCAITVRREAPSENRTEISCWRSLLLASKSAAILVQAITSSRVTDPNRIQSERRTPPTVLSLSGSTCTASLPSVLGNCLPSWLCTVAMSACASVTLTPGFNLPITVYQVDPRSCANGASKGATDQSSTSAEGN